MEKITCTHTRTRTGPPGGVSSKGFEGGLRSRPTPPGEPQSLSSCPFSKVRIGEGEGRGKGGGESGKTTRERGVGATAGTGEEFGLTEKRFEARSEVFMADRICRLRFVAPWI